MNIDNLENNFFKKQKSHTDYIIKCENGLNLPSKRLIEVKSNGDMSCLEISLQWLSQAQKNGLCVMVDSEFNCWPDAMEKYNIDLSELLYVPAPPPEDLYNMLAKLLEHKEIRLIVLSTITAMFPLIYDMKEFTEKISNLKEVVQNSNASVIIVNPYHVLSCDILNQTIYTKLFSHYINKAKIEVFFENLPFLFEHNHN